MRDSSRLEFSVVTPPLRQNAKFQDLILSHDNLRYRRRFSETLENPSTPVISDFKKIDERVFDFALLIIDTYKFLAKNR